MQVKLDRDGSGKATTDYRSLHEALTGNRTPHPAAKVLCGGTVLATAYNGRWELRDEGVSRLSEEFWGDQPR